MGGPLDGLTGDIKDVATGTSDTEVNEALNVMGVTGGKYYRCKDLCCYEWKADGVAC
jgi:hypothetical protein